MKKKLFILCFIIILTVEIFTRFYQFSKRADFGWDQVDNAWAAYDILVKHQYPLTGMEGKLNSGMHIGPLYYYLITPFYFFTGLDPVASPIIAGISALIGFAVLFWVTKQIFNTPVALIAVFINAVSFPIISADRVQWPVNFIPIVSYLILFFLFKVLTGEVKYLPLLAAAVGFSFHIHFTAVFFPIIIFLTLPFFPREGKTLKYILISLPVFIIFMLPNIINTFFINKSAGSFSQYFNTYYHGLHLRRVMQLSHDAFIKFETVLYFRIFRPLVFLFYPLFSFLLIYRQKKKDNKILVLLFGLWIIVPWLVFSTFAGEISDYYFNSTLFIAIAILSYLTYRLITLKVLPLKIAVIFFWAYYAFFNLQQFAKPKQGSLTGTRISAQKAVNGHKMLEFGRGNAEFYIYNYLKMKVGN